MVASPPAPGQPRRLGSAYVLTSLIGSGAQGEVWLGHRSDDPAAGLAVKLLRADLLSDPGVIERFVRERATLMRVRSPYVVGVRDMVVEGTTAAIVMDYVGGGDLRGLLDARGTLPPAEVARFGALVAEGLAAVHEAGIVHRDIKPANVLIDTPAPQAPGQQPSPWIPRLADFGVARICSTVTSSQATAAIGTPLYMAPEILDIHAPTPAADVYSLGIVLYEAACGVPPFAGAPTQVLGQHARRAPGRPQGIPDALWDIIEAMLAKQPGSRPEIRRVAQSLTAAAPALVGLPACPRMHEPPPGAPSAVPYVWQEEDSHAAQTAPTAVERSTPTMVAPPAPGAGEPTAIATQTAPGTASHNTVAPQAPVRPRRRRRALLLGTLITLIVVALVAGGAVMWVRHRREAALSGTIAALPAKARVVELRRLTDAEALAPGGGALVAEAPDGGSASSTALYDLDRADQAPVWQGECSEPRFWNATTLMCDSSDEVTLVSVDGSTRTDVPGPVDHNLVGSDGERAILIDDSYSGPLVALDGKDKETWRRDGDYSRAYVKNGFIVAYESHSSNIQVLSAATGDVLYSQKASSGVSAFGSTPGKTGMTRDPELGGISLNAGHKAFVVRGASSLAVYDAKGRKVGETPSSDSNSPGWAVSGDPEPADLVDHLKKTEGRTNTTAVVGAGASIPVSVDTVACTATRADKAEVVFTPPERSSGEACVITPVGLIGGDSAVLFSMGQPSSVTNATGEQLVAYDAETGRELWRTPGILVSALPPSGNASGDAAGQPRILMGQGGSGADVVVNAVVPD